MEYGVNIDETLVYIDVNCVKWLVDQFVA